MQKETYAIVILSVLYLVGIVGVGLPLHTDFVLLTPLNLLVSLGLVLGFHSRWTAGMWRFLLVAFLVGFLVEIVGVQTGLVFGDYAYGRVLGVQLWDTPLMIGVNWVLVSYCGAIAVATLLPSQSKWIQALVGAGILVALDVLIEPVAMQYGFWSWANDVVPLQNYIAWFGIAFGLIIYFYRVVGAVSNKVAIALLVLQFLFFGVLNIW